MLVTTTEQRNDALTLAAEYGLTEEQANTILDAVNDCLSADVTMIELVQMAVSDQIPELVFTVAQWDAVITQAAKLLEFPCFAAGIVVR